MKRARFTPAAVVELEDAARRLERARPGWGDKLTDEVLVALEASRSTSSWQTFDHRGSERRFVLDRFPCIAIVYGGREPGTGASGGRCRREAAG